MAKGDGFIFSQKVRGADEELKKYVFDPEGYVEKKGVVKEVNLWEEHNGSQTAPTFLMKSRPYPQKFWVTYANDRKRQIPLDVKQIVCYNSLYARRQKHKRAEILEKAKRVVAHPKRYSKKEAGGALRYVKNVNYNQETGECIDIKQVPRLDLDKAMEDAKYDGYYVIVTSEIDMPDQEVVKAYHGLWEIERSFRITKSNFKSRPVYVSLKNRIEGHFLTCYIALLILRLLGKRLNGKYSHEQIIKSLNKYQACFVKDNVFRLTYYDPVIEDIGDALNLTLNRRFMRTGEIRQLIASSKKTT